MRCEDRSPDRARLGRPAGPGLLVQLVATLGPWPSTLLDSRPMDTIYNGVLVGAAVLCAMRAVAQREERLAWSLIAVGLTLYAGGNIYWSWVLADLDEAPYPSVADGLWLSFYPFAYVAIVLLVRDRMPRLGVRLWLDGLIAALTVAALSAAIVFKAVRDVDRRRLRPRRHEPRLPARRHGPVRPRRRRDGRRPRPARPHVAVLGLGFAVFAVCDSIYLYQVAQGHLCRPAAARPRLARRRRDHQPRRLAAGASRDRPARRRAEHRAPGRAVARTASPCSCRTTLVDQDARRRARRRVDARGHLPPRRSPTARAARTSSSPPAGPHRRAHRARQPASSCCATSSCCGPTSRRRRTCCCCSTSTASSTTTTATGTRPATRCCAPRRAARRRVAADGTRLPDRRRRVLRARPVAAGRAPTR